VRRVGTLFLNQEAGAGIAGDNHRSALSTFPGGGVGGEIQSLDSLRPVAANAAGLQERADGVGPCGRRG
jgi:hypothetical protein